MIYFHHPKEGMAAEQTADPAAAEPPDPPEENWYKVMPFERIG